MFKLDEAITITSEEFRLYAKAGLVLQHLRNGRFYGYSTQFNRHVWSLDLYDIVENHANASMYNGYDYMNNGHLFKVVKLPSQIVKKPILRRPI